jgi:hypothetical protein
MFTPGRCNPLAAPSLLVMAAGLLACQGQTGTLETDPTAPIGQPSAATTLQGQWSPPFPWVNVAVHLSLLSNGKVLSFGRLNGGIPQVWDPGTGAFTGAPSPSLLFCAGHTHLSGGRLLTAGGHIQDGLGLPNANRFDATSGTWTAAAAMAKGRWYPTTIMLANGTWSRSPARTSPARRWGSRRSTVREAVGGS